MGTFQVENLINILKDLSKKLKTLLIFYQDEQTKDVDDFKD